MPDKDQDDRVEIDLGLKGLSIRGASEELRPLIKQAVGFASTFLRFLDNTVGLPAEFISHHLEPFRERYQRRVESIPENNRTVPPFRVGCQVLKEVAFAAEEPDIQRMFADLLGTSSDTETQHLVHPGFPDVINQLTPLDAKALGAFVPAEGLDPPELQFGELLDLCGCDKTEIAFLKVQASVDNLIRLGLLEWKANRVIWHGTAQVPRAHLMRPVIISDVDGSRTQKVATESQFQAIDSALRQISDDVGKALRQVSEKTYLVSTEFGRQFISACMPDAKQDDSKE